MFNQVKILDAKGKVKKVLMPKSLSQHYWGDFFDKSIKTRSEKVKRSAGKKRKVRKEPDLSNEEIYFSED